MFKSTVIFSRLLQRGLVTNIQLEKWGLVDTNLCSFCKIEKETLSHLFFQCNIVYQIWVQMEAYFVRKFGVQIEMNLLNVLLNRVCPIKSHVVNFICLIIKQYIYKQRCLKENLSVGQLTRSIIRVESIEKYIAICNGKLNIHQRKWSKANVQQQLSVSDFITQYVQNM